MSMDEMCECGHPAEMHEHYRPGTDCGECGSALCPEFRAALGGAA
jgi:hypothetical protein